ncbi:MAG TPA: DUF4230 domain-containing protein [Candidatus Saccharimonadales bacterium]|nr:DUF4230 domain-containing protein [Candidatus Saccharimonadales bacterium]
MKFFRPLLTIFVFVLILLVVGIFAFRFFGEPKEKYTVNLSSQTVIKQIRSLNRLETSSFTIEKIIDVGTSGNTFSQFLYGDRILLIAHGTVIAGFDLAKVQESDITVTDKTLNLKMPVPEILVTKLDNDQTRVYDRKQGLLTKGDNNLESKARGEAEKVIKDAACKGGILNEATKNARNQLTTLFKSLGFVTVIIEIPQGLC